VIQDLLGHSSVGVTTIAAQTASSFDVVIVGLSNTRALTQGEFRFTARGGAWRQHWLP
jgi:hypothetical protein